LCAGIIGALEDGTKELLAVVDGYRESTQSWRELLQQLKRQGLSTAPKWAIGDGSLGFWLARAKNTDPWQEQRCWVRKTADILDKMPKSVQGRAKQLIREMYLSPTRKAALAAYDQFITSFQVKFSKATECLEKDKEWLFTFYDFPAQHWSHPTNPIESTFPTVRLRTQRTKGCGPHRRLNHGLQARYPGPTTLAPIEWIQTHPQSDHRVQFIDGE
jgi:putative transposase